MDRLTALEALKTHAWLQRLFVRLSAKDTAFLQGFCRENAHLETEPFELAINRLFLDNPNKPRHWKEMLEILSNANRLAK